MDTTVKIENQHENLLKRKPLYNDPVNSALAQLAG
jgi:hypothetical protein